MFAKIENTPEDIFGIEMSGKIKKEDYVKMDAIMEKYKEKHDRIKFLIENKKV